MRGPLTSAVVCALLASCGEGSGLDDVEPGLFSANPTYERDIASLMERHCLACHVNATRNNGGVEINEYATAYSGRVKNVCVAVTPDVIERFSDVLQPYPRDPPVTSQPCNDWQPYSMPFGAKSRMTIDEQVIFARWVETGAPR